VSATPGRGGGDRPGADGARPEPVWQRAVSAGGAATLSIARDLGGITILLARVLRSLVPPTVDRFELLRNLHRMGNRSVPIIALTAFFTGGIMVIQSGVFVKRFNADALVGWGAGYTIFREVAPILIALMFSGRVGSNNTAELGTLTVTHQLNGLRALAIDPVRYLLVPRIIAMVLSLLVLVVLGDLVALTGGALFARLLLDIDYPTYYYSLVESLSPWDFLHGLVKAAVFGFSIALTSCYFGVTVRGGAAGVGRAVNNAVVSAAVSIMLFDFFVTYLLK
jgi:phospholipid/cholesterol/gamma-HCH transport system permease protein